MAFFTKNLLLSRGPCLKGRDKAPYLTIAHHTPPAVSLLKVLRNFSEVQRDEDIKEDGDPPSLVGYLREFLRKAFRGLDEQVSSMAYIDAGLHSHDHAG